MAGFDAIQSLVESQYPTPIAAVFRRCRTTRKEDLGTRHKNLIDLFEVIARFLGIVQLQEGLLRIPGLKSRLPGKEKALEFLKRPSIGGWVGLLRTLSTIGDVPPQARWFGAVSAWYREPKTATTRAGLELLDGIDAFHYESRTSTPNAEILNALVNYRNKQLGHGGGLREEALRQRLPVLEGVLTYLLQSLGTLADLRLMHVERIEKAEGKQWRVHAYLLRGMEGEPVELACEGEPDLAEMYLGDVTEGRLVQFVSLLPFVLWQLNDETKRHEVFFYNDAGKTKLEYLSFTSGAQYFHAALRERFGSILELGPAGEDVVDPSMPVEERAARAEELRKRAAVLDERDLLEDAVECLEMAVRYDRQAETYFEIARLQQRSGAPGTDIEATLRRCLELAPGHPAAVAMQASLVPGGEAALPNAAAPEPEALPWQPHPTVLHALTPPRFRSMAGLFWCVLLLAWFSFSALVEWLAGSPRSRVMGGLGAFPCAVVLLPCLALSRSILLRIKNVLFAQIDLMPREKWNTFYDQQMRLMYGHLVFENGPAPSPGGRPVRRFAFWKTVREERLYYAVWALLMVLMAVPYVLTAAGTVPVSVLVKCTVESMIWGLCLPGFRYATGVTVFVFRFSRLSLKPMLTRINEEGFRAFGELLTFNLGIAMVAYVAFWVLAAHDRTMVRLDAFWMAVQAVVLLTWSLALPLMIRRAARSSRGKATFEYVQHIERSFRAFLASPDDRTLERYQWLQARQKVIRRIGTWPLSLGQTMLVAGSCLLVVGLYVWFLLNQSGRLDGLYTRVAHWF